MEMVEEGRLQCRRHERKARRPGLEYMLADGTYTRLEMRSIPVKKAGMTKGQLSLW